MTSSNGKRVVTLYTLPVETNSKPVVRVEVDGHCIKASNLFDIGCNAIGLCSKSKPFFALFRGTIHPTKKYATDENVYVPCKSTLTIQRWSFDFASETIAIKTDAVAFRLIATQIISDIENGKLKVSKEEMANLREYYDPKFVCHKQFVDEARKLPTYNTTTILDVEIMNDAKFITTTLKEGTKVNLVLSLRKMIMISDSVELSVPWRKIRQFAEVKETKTINLEIFLADEKAFSWLELKSTQGTLLLQAMAEFIDLIRTKVERPMFRQPGWVENPKVNKLTWNMIKTELFGVGKKKKERFETFDDLLGSDEDEDEDEEEECQSTLSLRSGTSRITQR